MPVVKIDPTTATTHLLINQRAACGNPIGKPCNWPDRHYWVRVDRGFMVTCPKCQTILKEVHAQQKAK